MSAKDDEPMTKIIIREDETYPDYYFPAEVRWGRVVELEVPEEVATRWRAAREAWDAACEEIEAAYRAVDFGETERPYPGRVVRP